MRYTTQEKLDYLMATKKAIEDAIRKKGQLIKSTDTFRSYADEILSIEGGTSSEVADFNLHLAEAMMTRDAKYLGNEKILDFRGFRLSNGAVLGNLKSYSFAGFSNVEYMLFSDSVIMENASLSHNSKLRILDITSNEFGLWSAWSGSLMYNPALEAVIVRRGTAAVKQVIFSAGSVDIITDSDGTEHVNFYVYVPRDDYDTIVAAIPSDSPVQADRYRVLEDYPEYDKWNEKYTVNFYDGDVLLESRTVRHGESASCTATKNGQKFVQWNPAPTNVTANIDCYAEWIPENIADASWSQIASVAEAGRLSAIYAKGSKKDVLITYSDGTTETVTMVLEGYDTDLLSDDIFTTPTTKSKGIFLSKNALLTTQAGSSSRSYLNNTLYNCLPADLTSIIKKKATGAYTRDYLWAPSLTELGLNPKTYSSSADADSYSTAFSRYTTNADRIKCLGNDGEATRYWTRSTYSSDMGSISATGTGGFSSTSSKVGVVFGFCI